MRDSAWPLPRLTLGVGELRLRAMTEEDLPQVAGLLPGDVELDPAATRFEVGDEGTTRGLILRQRYWRAMGEWRPDQWLLPFVVAREGTVIGVQDLEAEDFDARRTVDTSSWLATDARGKGYGTRMRRAVLALAFGPLQARAAITSAWRDNHASLAVSRRLGYEENGVTVERRPGAAGVDTMCHLRLTREVWLERDGGRGVRIDGFEDCRPLFPPAAPED